MLDCGEWLFDEVRALLPSFDDVVEICATICKGKTFGGDCLLDELFRCCPYEVAWAILCVVHCVMFCCEEPIQWQGGVAHEILKAVFVSHLASGYRFVLLANVVVAATVYHSYFRSLLLPHINTYILDPMCGSFLERGADFAALLVYFVFMLSYLKRSLGLRSFSMYLQLLKVCKGFLFFSGSISDSQAVCVFRQLGFREHIFDDFW